MYLIIGAGPVGLGVAKTFLERKIPYEQVEADDEVGGNWYHGVYRTAHIVACKQVMEYPAYPMPDAYPDFPSQQQLSDYFIDYSHQFNLREHIQFGKKVIMVLPVEGNQWQVHFADGSEKKYQGVLICNGHHWARRFPSYPGTFSGEYFHAKDYKEPTQLQGKRVLVIGAGNSGSDIVCESARVGTLAHLSMRRSIWIFPKTFMGKPLGQMHLPKLPRFIESTLLRILIRLTFGSHSLYNLPDPDYEFFERHPTVSEELPYYLRHGKAALKPDVERFEGKTVHFTDGTQEDYDLIVTATGYHLSFPFLPQSLIRGEQNHLHVYGYASYEDYQGLYFVGWQQVRGGVGSMIERYAPLLADFVEIEAKYNVAIGAVLKALGEKPTTTHLEGSRIVFDWIKKKMKRQRLERKAQQLAKRGAHVNPILEMGDIALKRDMEVY